MLATGGSDAVINLWHDSTASDKEEAFRKEVRYLSVRFFYIETVLMLYEASSYWATTS